MTPILLPLAMVVASFVSDPRDLAAPPSVSLPDKGVVYLGRHGLDDHEVTAGGASALPGSVLPMGSSYPAAYAWSPTDSRGLSDGDAAQNQQAELAARDFDADRVSFGPAESEEEEFSWTRGGGIVGLGFRWRFQ